MGHSCKRWNTVLACPNVVFLIMDLMRTEEKWVPRKALALWDKSRNWNDSFVEKQPRLGLLLLYKIKKLLCQKMILFRSTGTSWLFLSAQSCAISAGNSLWRWRGKRGRLQLGRNLHCEYKLTQDLHSYLWGFVGICQRFMIEDREGAAHLHLFQLNIMPVVR